MKKIIIIYILLIGSIPLFSQTVIYSSDFTTAAGWSGWSIDNNYFSHYFTIPPHGSIAYVEEGDLNGSHFQEKLVSPQIDLSTYSSAFVTLSVYFFRQSYAGQTESLQLLGSTDGGSTWTLVKDIQGCTDWHREYADISAFCGNADVKIALQYSDNNGWLYGAGVDDLLLCTMQMNDAALMKVNKQDFWQVNTPYPIKLLLQNFGKDTITSAVVNYNVDGGTTQADIISGLNLAPLDTITILHSTPWVPAAGGHNISVWIESVNGTSDQNHSNDTIKFTLRNTVSSVPQKKVLIDWIKGTECSLCLHGTSVIDSIVSEHPGVIIPVSLYDAGMYGSYELIFDSIYAGPFPSSFYAVDDYYFSCANDAMWLSRGYIDKFDFEDVYGKCVERLEMKERVNERLDYVSPVSITASYSLDTLTRVINADVTATFFADLQGDFRFNGLILKDSIHFNQSNIFTTPGRWPYVNSLATVPWVHNHILIQSFGGRYGTAGSIPSSVTDGNSYSWHYTDTLKEQLINTDNLSLAFMVVEYDSVTGNSIVFNSIALPADSSATGIQPQTGDHGFIVYPNPADEKINIEIPEFTKGGIISVYNLQGQLLQQQTPQRAKIVLDIGALAKGIYFVKYNSSERTGVGRFVKE